jgi:hypothetical protein
MRIVFRGVTLLVAGALLGSVLAGQEQEAAKPDKTDKSEKPASDKPAAKAKKKEKLEYGTPYAGKLTKLDGEVQNFTVQVTTVIPDPQRVQDNTNHYNRRMIEISRIRNPSERQRQLLQLQADMQQRQANAGKKVTKDVDLQADENLVVRVAEPPTEYDDKGNPKKHTKKELEALKGPDKSLPGYKAEPDQLRKGQTVKVYPAKQKQTKTKSAAKTEDADAVAERPKVVMIMIMAEPKEK